MTNAGKKASKVEVTKIMHSIRLTSLNFGAIPFRKLKNLRISIAERITVIAGHNGIGKSTILGLIANGSGLRDATNQSYLNRAFVANLNEIVHLDYAKEYEEYKNSESTLPSPFIEYEIDGQPLIKRCAITGRTTRREVRVVPRNDPHTEAFTPGSSVYVGPDAKVPLPTLYLGMTRMLPVGESNPNWVTSTQDKMIDTTDAEFLQTFIDGVIGMRQKNLESNTITTQSIKGTGKTAKHPEYAYSAKCISLGQDSLSAIATALASFKKLQREWPDYPGGLLVIDEIDAGFHPHAQKKLVNAISNAAKKFRVQVLATTHSVGLIEAIHPDTNPIGPNGRHVDAVVYLTDSKQPRVAEGYSLADIQRDMSLIPPPIDVKKKAKILKIYLEDPEAHFFLMRLLTPTLKRRVKRDAGVGLKPIPLSVGCENLKGFYKHDPYFRTVLMVLDADASITGSRKDMQNIVKLPGMKDISGAGMSPERSLYRFIQALVNDDDSYPASRSKLAAMKLSSDYLQANFLDGDTNIEKRESAKKWMTSRLHLIEQWKLVELWLKEHTADVELFENELLAAAIATSKLV